VRWCFSGLPDLVPGQQITVNRGSNAKTPDHGGGGSPPGPFGMAGPLLNQGGVPRRPPDFRRGLKSLPGLRARERQAAGWGCAI